MADCEHNWVYQSETADTVTHKCTKCPATHTRPKGSSSGHVGRVYAVALAVMVAVCIAATIWAGGAA